MNSLIISLSLFVSICHSSFAKIYSTEPVEGIPKEWVEEQGPDVLRYANYIKSLNLKNVTPYMVLYPQFLVNKGRIRNSIPPRDLWPNIAETLKVVDKVSELLGAKVEPFLSGYRSPSYNRAVRGRSKSQSLVNNSVRVKFVGVSAYKVAATVRLLRKSGFFKGGVGRYTSYTHIDTRGHNADW